MTNAEIGEENGTKNMKKNEIEKEKVKYRKQ